MNQKTITSSILKDYGIELDDEKLEALASYLNEKLEERVGEEITSLLTDDQLEHVVELQEANKDDEMTDYIQQVVPDVQQVTQDEIDILLGEVVENLDEFTKNL